MNKIPVGISSCLIGEPVRFDGGHKRDAYIMGTLSEFFELRAFCPEVGIGMSIPRPTIHLIKVADEIHCVGVKNAELDVSDAIRSYANRLKPEQADLCGYILKKDSPSCGMERVKVYVNGQPQKSGTGIYAAQLMLNYPFLPIEEEGRLGDPELRENFIQRVYVFYRWKHLLSEGLTPARLTQFHARHKLILMSHDNYVDLGRLLANVSKATLSEVAEQYINQLMTTLKKVAHRKNHVNVLQHIQGYLKKQLDKDDKAELSEVIERYRIGELPLIVPITLLKHHFRKSPDPYIEDSYYMAPYPQELKLTNNI